MNFFESIKIAINSIAGNKLRSALTALGVIIGVAAVIALVSIGEGARQQVLNQIQSLGSNLLIVNQGRSGRGMASILSNDKIITTDDMEKIMQFSTVVDASASLSTNAKVKYGNYSFRTSVEGTTPSFQSVRNSHVASGIFFSKQDLTTRRKVAVLGNQVAQDLFNGADPLGKTIKINRQAFTVIGVMEEKGTQGFSNNDDKIFIPLSTLQKRIVGTNAVQGIYVQVKSENMMDLTSQQIRALLSKKFDDPEDYDVRSQADILSTAQNMTKTFTLLLGGIAGISLLVGGIGIMNIMLVSVTERTREIGIRKAIGARRRDILGQFLIESIVLSVVGGMIGIALGYGASLLIARFAGWTTTVSVQSIVLAFGFSVGVGLFFGIYPASKASRLRPIDALRYE